MYSKIRPTQGRQPMPHLIPFFSDPTAHPRVLHSFPSRRSSDLSACSASSTGAEIISRTRSRKAGTSDRKSTRLNSSHITTSYAVFCLKKKKQFIRAFALHDIINDL